MQNSLLTLGSLTNKFSGVNFNMQGLQMFHSYATIIHVSKGSKHVQTPQYHGCQKLPIVGPSSVKFNPLTTSDAIWCHLTLAACSVGTVRLEDMFYTSWEGFYTRWEGFQHREPCISFCRMTLVSTSLTISHLVSHRNHW